MEKRQNRTFAEMRKPFQGISNIIRFNRHFYIFAAGLLLLLIFLQNFISPPFHIYGQIIFSAVFLAILISSAVSFYVYDLSNLYKLDWIDNLPASENQLIVNIHAGFDETSELLERKFENSKLIVFDFYDAEKHTEISIKRARKLYPPYPETKRISTDRLPLSDAAADKVFLILSAHEIRNSHERERFFAEINRILKSEGRITVTEHLRDAANFFAYNVGFLHFHSRETWLETFASAGLNIEKESKITPFITTFILKKNGTSP